MAATVRNPSYPEGVDEGEQPSLPPPQSSTMDPTTDVRECALRIAQEVFTRGLASAVSAAGQHFSPRPHQVRASHYAALSLPTLVREQALLAPFPLSDLCPPELLDFFSAYG